MNKSASDFLLLLVIGWLVAHGIQGWWQKIYQLPPDPLWLGTPLQMEGRIDALVKPLKHTGLQCDVQVLRWCLSLHCLERPGRVRLYWYGKHPPVHAGEQWRWTVKLKAPRGEKDPGLFDYGYWLRWQGFVATGFVLSGESSSLVKAHPWQSALLQWREMFSTFVDHHVYNAQRSSILRALATGDHGGLVPATWDLFKNTGTNHLLAISGLHIGLVGSWGYVLFGWLTRRWPGICYVMARPLWQSVGGVGLALYYSALAGGAISTQRALAMLLLPTVGKFHGRALPWLRQCLLLMGFFILIEPSVLISPAFYLSFAAVIWILYSVWGQWGKASHWQQGCVIQMVLTAGLLPLTLWFFQGGSTVSLAANGLAIPWFTLIVVPLVLGASVVFLFSKVLSGCLLKGASITLIPIIHYLQYLNHGALWFHSIPGWWIPICAMTGVFILALPRGLGLHRCIGLLWFFPLLFWPYATPKAGEWWFTLLDVGQGLAAVVRTHKHLLVFDTGPVYGNGLSAGTRVLVPYLRHEGISRVDTLVVSHGDRDHSGGVVALQQAFPIKHFIVGQRNHPELEQGEGCYGGEGWDWDGVHFKFLYPAKGEKKSTANAHSCVLRISDGINSVLLPGDIGFKEERLLLQRWSASQLTTSVLVAAHHGSCHGSSADFLSHVHPKKVLFSYGFENPFHFPCKKLVDYLVQQGIEFASTAESGAIVLQFHKQGR